jgi:hypothetical protein
MIDPVTGEPLMSEQDGDDEHSDQAKGQSEAGEPDETKGIRHQGRIFAFAVILLIVFLALMAAGWASPDRIRADRFMTYGLVAFSASFAAFAYGFLGRQTAKLEVKYLGGALSASGAGLTFFLVFAALQFVVRGTSSLYIALYSDDAFTHLWSAPPGQAAPEFSASLRDYSIVVAPERSNLRVVNLPMFEWVTISVRDPRWQVTKIASDEKACTVQGQRLKGWCTEAQLALQYSECIEDWRGGGSIPPGTLADVVEHFRRTLQEAHYPAKLKYAMTDRMRRVLGAKVGAVAYSDQDFCTAINGVKNEIERTVRLPLKIKLGCAYIGIAVGDDQVPDLTEEPNGWKKSC